MSATQVGRITFGTVANPAAWDIGDSSYLTFGSPTEAKRAEELFTAMQRELAAKAEECKRLRKNIYMTEEKLVVIRDSTYRDAVTLRAMAAAVLEALREGK